MLLPRMPDLLWCWGSSRGGVIVISRQNWASVSRPWALLSPRLGLSACGRKGPLDAAAVRRAQPAQAAPAPAVSAVAAPPGPAATGVGSGGKAVAPPPTGQNRPFILDWLVE